jgi:hypothetical protein
MITITTDSNDDTFSVSFTLGASVNLNKATAAGSTAQWVYNVRATP